MSQTDRETDGQMTYDRKTELCTIMRRAIKLLAVGVMQKNPAGVHET